VLYGVRNIVIAGNVVSAIVFWPGKNETFTSSTFLLTCLAVFDNITMVVYYFHQGMVNTCIFYDTCQCYMKVRADNKGMHTSDCRVWCCLLACEFVFSHLDISTYTIQWE